MTPAAGRGGSHAADGRRLDLLDGAAEEGVADARDDMICTALSVSSTATSLCSVSTSLAEIIADSSEPDCVPRNAPPMKAAPSIGTIAAVNKRTCQLRISKVRTAEETDGGTSNNVHPRCRFPRDGNGAGSARVLIGVILGSKAGTDMGVSLRSFRCGLRPPCDSVTRASSVSDSTRAVCGVTYFDSPDIAGTGMRIALGVSEGARTGLLSCCCLASSERTDTRPRTAPPS